MTFMASLARGSSAIFLSWRICEFEEEKEERMEGFSIEDFFCINENFLLVNDFIDFTS